MNPQRQPQKPITQKNESAFTALLLIFCVFLIVFACLTATQSCMPAETPDQTQDSTPTTSDQQGPDDPPVSTPIFANGVLPSVLPLESSGAVELTSELTSPYAVIVDIKNNTVLAGKKADMLMSPASMTKVMTLIVACEKLTEYDLTQQLTLNEYYNSYDYNGLDLSLIDGTKYLNDRFYIKDLLYGIGVSSAADCVLMIAEKAYGTMDAFVIQMNQKATELGLTQTKFVDAAGDDLDGNVTTPKEMAVIMAYAMQCPLICQILSEDTYSYKGYYEENGVQKEYNRLFQSHLFGDQSSSRIKRYEEAYGKFTLATTKNLMGKTGYLDSPARSYLVCAATGASTGNAYVVVVGENSGFATTMKDVKFLFDTYAK